MQRNAGGSYVNVDDGSLEAVDAAMEQLAHAAVSVAEQIAAVRANAKRVEELVHVGGGIDAFAALGMLEIVQDLAKADTVDDAGECVERARAFLATVAVRHGRRPV